MPEALLRNAQYADIDAMLALIMKHGPNPWNYLPHDEIREHLNSIATKTTHAVVAEKNGNIVGFATFHPSDHLRRFFPPSTVIKPQGYVREVVVDQRLKGQGLGTKLLKKAVKKLAALGYPDVYIERHEENLGSAGMMRKAGFKEIATFDDPEYRKTGSRRTTVCKFSTTDLEHGMNQ